MSLRNELIEIIEDESTVDYDGNVVNAAELADIIIAKFADCFFGGLGIGEHAKPLTQTVSRPQKGQVK